MMTRATLIRSTFIAALSLTVLAASARADSRPADRAPVLVDAHYHGESVHGRDHLWVRLAPVPGADRYVLERVWGAGPIGLDYLWSRAFSAADGHAFFYPRTAYGGDAPFTVGFVARALGSDGQLGPASEPLYVTHTGRAPPEEGPRSDHILFAFLAVGLLVLWRLYRREPSHEFKIRLAAAAALSSLMFLSVTPAMPWIEVADPSGAVPTAACQLGDEVGCASYAPDGGPDPTSAASESIERRFELDRWSSASAALRMGLVMSLIMLLPALIWLSVAPLVRPAQAAVVVGASAAAFTFVAALFYRLAVPSWMQAEVYWTFDVALLATVNIAVAAGLIARSAFALCEPPPVPRAQVVR